MNLHRISVKYFVTDPTVVNLDEIVPVFHRWIQNQSVEGFLIDVADYKHVCQGPGVVLIGHEADYALDMTGGRPGLLYSRKRRLEGELAEQVFTAFRLALGGCRALELEPSLKGRLRFGTDEAELKFLDRLRAPPAPETFRRFRADLQAALARLYPGRELTLEPAARDPRECFTVHIRAPGAPDAAGILGIA